MSQPTSDKLMMTRPDLGSGWPLWPLLPLKRRIEHKTEVGFLLDTTRLGDKVDPNTECYRTIYLGYFFDLKNKDPKDFTKKVYESVDALLADGWIID